MNMLTKSRLNVTKSLGKAKILYRIYSLAERVGWAAIFAVVPATDAFAQAAGATGTDPAAILTNITGFILGPFGQSLAILGIIAIGLSWMFGRASLGLIAGVVGGIVIMFGASYLGNTLLGSAGTTP